MSIISATRSTSSEMPDLVVVGGGIVGAVAAHAMARAGFAVTLIEAYVPRPWDAADELDLHVVALAPSSVALLENLGIWSSVCVSRVSPYRHMVVWDCQNGGAIHFDASCHDRDVLGYIVEKKLLQWHLWQALDESGVELVCPARVLGFETFGDRVSLTLDSGDTISTRLLVAADGGASPLRQMAGIAVGKHDYAQHAVVAHVVTEHGHQDTAWQCFLPSGPLALLPLLDGRSAVVWSLPEEQVQRVLAMDDGMFCDALGVASDFRLGCVQRVTRRMSHPLRLQLAERYQDKRLVLLGDAAHVVHPLAGQGVNMGLRDVLELHAVLYTAREDGVDFSSVQVLRRYARRRRSADTLDAYAFDALARLYAYAWPPLVGARGLGMRLLDRTTWLKRRIIAHAAGV